MARDETTKKPIGSGALWLAVLALLILVAAYWLMKTGKVATSNQTAGSGKPKQEVTQLTPIKNPKPSPVSKVAFANGAFSPANLSIPTGTTVTFTSSDATKFHLVSSLPGFNSVQDVTDYAFTFSQPGEYDYHNADNPPQAGQITVNK
jgi:plastocyanin